LAVYTEFL